MRVKYYCSELQPDGSEKEYIVSELCGSVQGGLSRLLNTHADKFITFISFHVIVYGKEKGRVVAQRAHVRSIERHQGDNPGEIDWLVSSTRRK